MSCSILRPGLLTTIQDAGRFGYQQAGVIVSGPMDPWSLRLANLLVGNPAGTAGLEITLLGPTIRFETDHLICMSGADLSATLDDQQFPLNRPVAVRQGSKLAFGAARSGCRAYLALSGGLTVPTVLGSQSTYLRAQLGGLAGRALQAGDVVPAAGPTPAGQRLHQRLLAHSASQRWAVARWYPAVAPAPAAGTSTTVRALRGPEFELFTEESQQAFWQQEFTVTPNSDRMGYRLAGPELHRQTEREILSTAVTFGTVQVPAAGNPIVLMADHQTTGGYPRIGQVISADFSLLAQVPPGGHLRFQEVGLTEAQYWYLHQEKHLQQLHRALALLHYS
ncbi:biotin-dependent carboxyltransferase family protein [Hymenobacter wooponensis]|uniref:Biotin-dependent carboxyltransferase family protein n=1 Tax=Hymenobacter wooponensis TaxID=1525360 RepID=A0A4Z0MC84_9BACT|nr:biotin-dependent carboxyltransferase family protein [Hymenobacter wooponensis]TGD77121.1 biotin-dependent carboxyltransferase family protein [Hymenobacter wooponensis]